MRQGETGGEGEYERGREEEREREIQRVRQRHIHPTRIPSLMDVVQSLAPLQAITLA